MSRYLLYIEDAFMFKKQIIFNVKLFVSSILLAILCVIFFIGCMSIDITPNTKFSKSTTSSDKAQIYYLNVGQGDAQLIILPTGEHILIDAGLKSGSNNLVNYLQELGVEKLDIVIATHPHADHIGGMEKVIQTFTIGEIYMPKVADSQIPTTVTYTKFLEAIQSKGLRINQAKAGTVILNSGNAVFEILAPNSTSYKKLNDYSVVTKLTYGSQKFIFTGDAEKTSEDEMLKKHYDLSCNILKLAHHGSSSSSTDSFLKAASPAIAIVSCGIDNDYGHPHKEIIKKMNVNNITVYRTDTHGTILAETDGTNYHITTNLKNLTKAT